jgi:hypothetical protein
MVDGFASYLASGWAKVNVAIANPRTRPNNAIKVYSAPAEAECRNTLIG